MVTTSSSDVSGSWNKYITFNGAFNDKYLKPLQALANVLGPFDECAGGDQRTVDTLALFELIGLEGIIDVAFGNHLVSAAKELQQLNKDERRKCTSLKQAARREERVNQCYLSMRDNLRQHGYMIIAHFLTEVMAMNQQAITIACLDFGYDLPSIRKQALIRLQVYGADVAEQDTAKESFGWFELAPQLGSSMYKPAQVADAGSIRELLRNVELAQFSSCDLPTGIRCPENQRELLVRIVPTTHPLNLCQVEVVDPTTATVRARAEFTRMFGNLTFPGCSITQVSWAFNRLGLKRVYDGLRDQVAHDIHDLISDGTLKQQIYRDLLSELDEDDEETNEDEEDEIDYIFTPYSYEHPAPQTETESTTSNDIEPERTSYTRIGTSRLRYRNVLSTLRSFGVESSRDGKHIKLELNGRTASFLNPHTREKNIRYSQAALRRALKGLDIDERTFFARL